MDRILLKVLDSDKCGNQKFSLINSNNFRLQKDFATQESPQEQPTPPGKGNQDIRAHIQKLHHLTPLGLPVLLVKPLQS